MRRLYIFLLFLSFITSTYMVARGQSPSSSSPGQSQQAPVIQTEKVQVPESLQAPPSSMASQPGYMLPAQTKQLLDKIWQTEQRIRDLLSQVHPEALKMPPAVAATLARNVAAVTKNLDGLEDARARFAGRPDSEYFGFETYSGMAMVLPRLGEVADPVYRYQGQSLGSDLRQAWNDLFALEQALSPYIAFLTRNHDQIYTLTQGNLYACQDQLNHAGKSERAVPMKNILPEFKGHPRHKKKPATPASPEEKKQQSSQ